MRLLYAQHSHLFAYAEFNSFSSDDIISRKIKSSDLNWPLSVQCNSLMPKMSMLALIISLFTILSFPSDMPLTFHVPISGNSVLHTAPIYHFMIRMHCLAWNSYYMWLRRIFFSFDSSGWMSGHAPLLSTMVDSTGEMLSY